jgi:hypothetical protein
MKAWQYRTKPLKAQVVITPIKKRSRKERKKARANENRSRD